MKKQQVDMDPAASDTKEDLLVREAIDRIKRIEENLGIPKQ